ncbi:MAG: SprT-like domain-containing protein [Muribaculaceae bacterium]|nr:SprT-like domain-containing protein [Muribaculaceae bacterium]
MFAIELPDVPMSITNGKQRLGCLHTNLRYNRNQPHLRYKMTFSGKFDIPQNQLEDILLHEMIHLAIDYARISDSGPHGHTFKTIMNTINKHFGRNISVRLKMKDVSEHTLATPTRSFVFTFHLNRTNRDAFMRCASTVVLKLYRQLKGLSDVSDIKLYLTFNPYFALYPNSRTLRYFILTEEISQKLSPGDLVTLP